jgi:hypothetical protein
MHVHATQPNPYAQLDALRSAQQAAARREAARVRKELLESASELVAESDFSDLSVTPAEERQESQRQSKRGSKRNAHVRQNPMGEETTDSEDTGSHVSDWA